jgi:hypothetical protein
MIFDPHDAIALTRVISRLVSGVSTGSVINGIKCQNRCMLDIIRALTGDLSVSTFAQEQAGYIRKWANIPDIK